MVKPSCKKLKELIKDEESGYKTYRNLGLKNLAKDEKRHKLYLMRIVRRQCNNG